MLLSIHITIVSHCALFRMLCIRLFCFALLCGVIWQQNTNLQWYYHPEEGGFNQKGAFIFPNGSFCPPKRALLSLKKVDIKTPHVVLNVVLSPF